MSGHTPWDEVKRDVPEKDTSFNDVEDFFARLESNPPPWYRMLRYRLERWARAPRRAYGFLKNFWQRGRRGYGFQDLWSFDSYLLSWLPEALEELRDMAHGYPSNFWDDEGTDPAGSQDGFERWQATLTQMAEGFKAGRVFQDCSMVMQLEEQEERLKRHNEAMDLFKKHFFDLWD